MNETNEQAKKWSKWDKCVVCRKYPISEHARVLEPIFRGWQWVCDIYLGITYRFTKAEFYGEEFVVLGLDDYLMLENNQIDENDKWAKQLSGEGKW